MMKKSLQDISKFSYLFKYFVNNEINNTFHIKKTIFLNIQD